MKPLPHSTGLHKRVIMINDEGELVDLYLPRKW